MSYSCIFETLHRCLTPSCRWLRLQITVPRWTRGTAAGRRRDRGTEMFLWCSYSVFEPLFSPPRVENKLDFPTRCRSLLYTNRTTTVLNCSFTKQCTLTSSVLLRGLPPTHRAACRGWVGQLWLDTNRSKYSLNVIDSLSQTQKHIWPNSGARHQVGHDCPSYRKSNIQVGVSDILMMGIEALRVQLR